MELCHKSHQKHYKLQSQVMQTVISTLAARLERLVHLEFQGAQASPV